jgi:hypothetical protein
VSQPGANTIVAGSGAQRLRVSFAERLGQFVGSVWLEESRQAWELLRELQLEDQIWPASPPWQELHVHEQHGFRALMLVGRAGTSHWSMAVSADDAQRAIVFDVACRLRSTPRFLGTTYALIAPAKAIGEGVEIGSKDEPARVLVKPLAIDNGLSAMPDLHQGTLVVRPLQTIELPATIRWKYCAYIAE